MIKKPRRSGRWPARSSTTGPRSPPSNPALPATNNEAERALRDAVIARRISNGTRTQEGSAAYAATLSVFETCRRRGIISLTSTVHQTPCRFQSRPPCHKRCKARIHGSGWQARSPDIMKNQEDGFSAISMGYIEKWYLGQKAGQV
jgi:hypothetical protein